MPVRKIPRNRLSVTGVINEKFLTSELNGESYLELDFYNVVAFDSTVKIAEDQPLCIEYLDDNSTLKAYTLDTKIIFKDYKSKSLLVEVKFLRDLIENKDAYKRKFEAAIRYSAQNGYEYRILSDFDIRTSYLRNAIFFRPYRTRSVDGAIDRKVEHIVKKENISTPNRIIEALKEEVEKVRVIVSMWRMISVGEICTDLNKLVTMDSDLKLGGSKGFFQNLEPKIISTITKSKLLDAGIDYQIN
jgi:hypothetical protein